MSKIVKRIFRGKSPIYKELLAYGFELDNAGGDSVYCYSCSLMNDAFRADVSVKAACGSEVSESRWCVSAWLIDTETGEEYTPVENEQYTGAYVGAVREAYTSFLSEIASSCFFTKGSAWIIPSRPSRYDIWDGFAKSPDRTILWHQRIRCVAGDVLFIYQTEPVAAVVCRCEVIEADIMDDEGDGFTADRRLMRIKLIERYLPELYPRRLLNEHGIKVTVRGQRSCPAELLNVILYR